MNLPTVPLGDVASFIRGINFKPDDVVSPGTTGSVVCMRTKNVQSDLDLSDLWAVPRKFVKREEQYLKAGDTLVSSANSWNLVGKCCWIPDLPWGASFGGFISVLRPDSQRIDARYLYRWFSSDRVQTIVRSFGRQTTNISNLDFDRCLALEVPLPSLVEQRRIADILDRAKALRAKRQRTIKHLADLTEAHFLAQFAGPTSAAWERVRISDLASLEPNAIRTGPFGSQLLHSEFVDDGVAVLGIDNVVENEFKWGKPRFITPQKYRQLARYRVSPGDVLITIMATCGRCVVVPDDIPLAINTKHICAITLDRGRCLPEYLRACFLLHPEVRDALGVHERGAVMPGLNMQIIKDLRIPLAPINLQERYAHFLNGVASAKERAVSSAAALDSVFDALQHRAFRGGL